MAFEFPHRDPTRLFFPTVHVHDGRVHARAEFDRAAGLVDGDAHCLRRTIRGLAPNQDTWL